MQQLNNQNTTQQPTTREQRYEKFTSVSYIDRNNLHCLLSFYLPCKWLFGSPVLDKPRSSPQSCILLRFLSYQEKKRTCWLGVKILDNRLAISCISAPCTKATRCIRSIKFILTTNSRLALIFSLVFSSAKVDLVFSSCSYVKPNSFHTVCTTNIQKERKENRKKKRV